MIREIAGYERGRSVRTQNQEEETELRRGAGLVSLCLDTGGREGERGELYHLCGTKPVAFCSLFEAVNRMEELYDALSGPQAPARLRSFAKAQRMEELLPETVPKQPAPGAGERLDTGALERLLHRRGAKATFWIRVLYRQHASWQGEVTWVERQKKEYFRSTLELLRLIGSALGAEDRESRT